MAATPSSNPVAAKVVSAASLSGQERQSQPATVILAANTNTSSQEKQQTALLSSEIATNKEGDLAGRKPSASLASTTSATSSKPATIADTLTMTSATFHQRQLQLHQQQQTTDKSQQKPIIIEQQQQSQRQPYPTVQSASVSSTAGGALTQSSTSFAYLVKPVRDVTLSQQPQQKPGKKAECLEVWSNIPDLFISFFFLIF